MFQQKWSLNHMKLRGAVSREFLSLKSQKFLLLKESENLNGEVLVFSGCYKWTLEQQTPTIAVVGGAHRTTLWGKTLWCAGMGSPSGGHCWSSSLASSQCQSWFDHCEIVSDFDLGLPYWNLKHPNSFETSKCLDNCFQANYLVPLWQNER